MHQAKNIVIGLLLFLAGHSFLMGQAGIDSLRSILDKRSVPDSLYVKASVELCKVLANTENEFLLPEYALKGLQTDPLNKDIQSKFALYNFLGNYYWKVGKLNEAAEQFNQMRMIGETSSDTHITSSSYIGLGIVYYIMGNNDRALEYYRKGLAISGTDSLLKVRFYNNIANTFSQQNKLDSALLYYNYSITYHQSHQNFRYLSNTYANISIIYQMLKNGPEIRKNIALALQAAMNSADPGQTASVYQLMGDLAFEQHPDLAAKCFNQSLDLAQKINSYAQIRMSLENLSNLSRSTGNYVEAYTYLRRLKNLEDSLDLQQAKSRILQMEYQHLASMRNIEEMKKVQREEVKAIRDQNRQKNVLIILCVVLATVLAFFLMRIQNYRLKMKINRTKERFFSLIAHDIRNPFSGILGLSGLLNEEAEKSEDPVHRKRVQSLDQSLNHVYELLENLLQWSQSETGKIAFHPMVQQLSPFVNEVIELHIATAKQKGITIENQVPSGLAARFDSNMLQTILRNLLSNSIKFSEKNSSIILSAEIRRKEVVVRVSDEGIGMTPEQADRIFKSEKGITTIGTRKETGTGMGLILCKNFITRQGGRIWIESKPGVGTTMFFTLPFPHSRE